MASLLVVARAIEACARQYPKEAAPYFMAAYNAILDITPPAAVWVWQIIKIEERLDEHKKGCTSCASALDCPRAIKLYSRLKIYRSRLAKAETWIPTQQA
jgi:hypothetical protein